MASLLPRFTRPAAGALAGALVWWALHAGLRGVPAPIRFFVSFAGFTLGPGLICGGWLTRRFDPLRRTILLLGIGSAATPVLIDLLGRLGGIPAFPYLAWSAVGAGLAAASGRSPHDPDGRVDRADVLACVGLTLFVAVLGVVVFSQRLAVSPAGVVLYGDYDSADLGYYAAEASEASHTVPPTASYYSGHKLNAAYYCHLVLGMISRFADVPVLSMYYGYAWPTFDVLIALTAFVMIRLIASRQVAVLSVVLIFLGSDFSYLAAWFLPHRALDWDYLLWPTNFLSPTAQVLHFATWAPALIVFFTAIFSILRGYQTRERGWLVMSGFLIGMLFEFKPFAYVVLMAALSASAVFAFGDRFARWRSAATVASGVLFTTPFLYEITQMDPGDRRTRLLVDPFLLPLRMLIKLDLTDAFTDAANRFVPIAALRRPMILTAASVIFLLVGVGVRWLGWPGVWRSIWRRDGPDAASWRLLAWGVIAGIAIPFVLATDPYVDTLQFYLTGLYLMWIFTAVALVAIARARPRYGWALVALAVMLTLPSSLHYFQRKLTDQTRQPKASLTADELKIADYLRTTDPEKTVVLHDRPLSPSLMTIVTARRIVLGWDVRYSAVGGEGRLRDVNRFFASAERDSPEPAMDVLRRYRVTHVIVRPESDRVHPGALAQLQPILRFPEVVLYAVPPMD